MVRCLRFVIGSFLTSWFSGNKGPTEQKKADIKEFIKNQRSDGKIQSVFWYWHSSLDEKDEKLFRSGH